MAVDAISPTARQHSRVRQPPAMRFEWRPCPKHAFLGVSVLAGSGFSPTCMPHDGPPHSVDPGELESAA